MKILTYIAIAVVILIIPSTIRNHYGKPQESNRSLQQSGRSINSLDLLAPTNTITRPAGTLRISTKKTW